MADGRRSLDRITLEVSRAELVLINNALNEVCNGVDIADEEFGTRLGGSREEVRALLLRIGRRCAEAGASGDAP
jgi:hypothetical protein